MAVKRGRGSQRGPRGARGARGPSGVHGPAGPRGPAGPPGPKPSSADILVVVDDQFAALRSQLDVQLTRMAQIQRQLDEIQSLVKKALSQSSTVG